MSESQEKTIQSKDAPRKRRGVWWYTWRLMAVVVGWVILSFVWLVLEGSEKLVISPETTVITEPLGEDGLVDYVAWLNRDSKVPAERNAAITILQILGPAAMPDIYGGFSLDATTKTPDQIDIELPIEDALDPTRGVESISLGYVVQRSSEPAPKFPHPTTFSKSLLDDLGASEISAGRRYISWGAFDDGFDELLPSDRPETEWEKDNRIEEELLAKEAAELAGKSISPVKPPTGPRTVYLAGHGKVFDETNPLYVQFVREEDYWGMYELENSYVALTSSLLENLPKYALWLKLNRGVTDPLIGLKADRWYLPIRTGDGSKVLMNIHIPLMVQMRELAKLASQESRLDFAEGKIENGYRRMLGLWRVARAMQYRQSTLIGWMVGLGVEQVARNTLASGLDAGLYTPKDLRAIQAEMETLSANYSPRYPLLHGERFCALDLIQRSLTIQMFADSIDWHTGYELAPLSYFPRSANTNQMLRRAVRHYPRLLATLEGEDDYDGNSIHSELLSLSDEGRGWMIRKKMIFVFGTPGMKRQAATDVMSSVLFIALMPAVDRIWMEGRDSSAKRKLLEAGIALELYRKAHDGKLPATLAAGLGERAKRLMTQPKHKSYPESMRLTVIGDTTAPEGYAVWFPRPGSECYFVYGDEDHEATDAELQAIANDPAKIELRHRGFGNSILYIPISAKAKAAWKAMEMEGIVIEKMEEPDPEEDEAGEGFPLPL